MYKIIKKEKDWKNLFGLEEKQMKYYLSLLMPITAIDVLKQELV